MSLSDELSASQVAAEHRREIDRLQRAIDREKDRTDAIVAAVRHVIRDHVRSLDLPPVPPPTKDRRRKDAETAIVMLSDWQLGKRTPSYDSDVCATRVELMASKVAELAAIQRADHPVKHCAVFLLGDMIEGEMIFPGQAHEVDSSLGRQVAKDGPRILAGFIRHMLANFETVSVHAVPGNHGRIGGRASRESHPETNGDRMLYWNVETILDGEDRLTWQIPERDPWIVADLGEGCRFMLLHGDQVRGSQGIPWYGWSRRVQGLDMMSRRIWNDLAFDYVAAGHFHTPVSLYINGARLWINASTESHNPYAAQQLGAAGEPAQWLLFAQPGRGVTAEYLVSLK